MIGFAETLYYPYLDDCTLKMSVFQCLEFRDSTSRQRVVEKRILIRSGIIYILESSLIWGRGLKSRWNINNRKIRVVPHVWTWIEIKRTGLFTLIC